MYIYIYVHIYVCAFVRRSFFLYMEICIYVAASGPECSNVQPFSMTLYKRGFPKIRCIFLADPIVRTIVFGVYIGVPHFVTLPNLHFRQFLTKL